MHAFRLDANQPPSHCQKLRQKLFFAEINELTAYHTFVSSHTSQTTTDSSAHHFSVLLSFYSDAMVQYFNGFIFHSTQRALLFLCTIFNQLFFMTMASQSIRHQCLFAAATKIMYGTNYNYCRACHFRTFQRFRITTMLFIFRTKQSNMCTLLFFKKYVRWEMYLRIYNFLHISKNLLATPKCYKFVTKLCTTFTNLHLHTSVQYNTDFYRCKTSRTPPQYSNSFSHC